MQTDSALKIISSLANGCDPLTGEVLPPSHIVQQPDVIRAFGIAVTALRAYTEGQDSDNSKPSRNGVSWATDEDEELLLEFDRGVTIKKLAAKHQRTRGAIKSRLIRLGRLDPPSRASLQASS